MNNSNIRCHRTQLTIIFKNQFNITVNLFAGKQVNLEKL